MNFPFEGLVSGSKWGSAIGVIMFMLLIGGSFGVVIRTGTIDNGILYLIDKTKGSEILFIPVLFLLFSLGGAFLVWAKKRSLLHYHRAINGEIGL